MLGDFKMYLKATVIQTMCYWYKNKHIDLWNEIESLEGKSFIYGQSVFSRLPRPFSGGKNDL